MKRLCVLAVLCGLSFGGCGGSGNTVEEAYSDFYSAMMSSEVDADEYIGSVSLDYVDGIMAWVFRGEEAGLKELSLFDRYLALRIRMEYGEWDQEDWEAWAEERSKAGAPVVDERIKKLIRPFLVERRLGEVSSYGGVVGGQLSKGGYATGRRIAFVEEGDWKVDLISFWQSDFEGLIGSYLSDNYRNTDRLEAMLREGFGERFSKALYVSRMKLDEAKADGAR